jgi:hypothetical protein
MYSCATTSSGPVGSTSTSISSTSHQQSRCPVDGLLHPKLGWLVYAAHDLFFASLPASDSVPTSTSLHTSAPTHSIRSKEATQPHKAYPTGNCP